MDRLKPVNKHLPTAELESMRDALSRNIEVIDGELRRRNPNEVYRCIHYGYGRENYRLARRGDCLEVTLTYPPYEDEGNPDRKVRHVHVDQESVRATDGIRMHYDYSRDGWAIEQASRFSWLSDENCDEDWQEVAFIQSWARKESDEDEARRLGLLDEERA